MDNYYPIEVKICSKNGWSTPQEVAAIWGANNPYRRTGITSHWWGDGTGASNHDNIVNYFLSQAQQGNKSVHYVLSDNKITLMVSPDMVAWCSNGGNPSTISIEHQPTLGAEGYKKSGWLVAQLEARYGRRLEIFRHDHWTTTQCCGSVDINRIRAEADKWNNGGYNAPPAPAPAPIPAPAPTITLTHSVLPKPVLYKLNKNANLWNYNAATWADFKAVKQFTKGDIFTVYAIADNHNVHGKYGVTEYSYGKQITNGINMVDLDIVSETPQPIPVPPPVQVDPNPAPAPNPTPIPVPTPVPTPTPVEPPTPQPVEPDKGAIIAFLRVLITAISEFLNKFRR